MRGHMMPAPIVPNDQVTGSLESSALFNADPAPIPPTARTWSMWSIAALWVGMAICITTYTLASSLIEQGMNWKQAVLTSAPLVGVQTAQITGARHEFTELTPGQTYLVQLNALGAAGASDWSPSPRGGPDGRRYLRYCPLVQ